MEREYPQCDVAGFIGYLPRSISILLRLPLAAALGLMEKILSFQLYGKCCCSIISYQFPDIFFSHFNSNLLPENWRKESKIRVEIMIEFSYRS